MSTVAPTSFVDKAGAAATAAMDSGKAFGGRAAAWVTESWNTVSQTVANIWNGIGPFFRDIGRWMGTNSLPLALGAGVTLTLAGAAYAIYHFFFREAPAPVAPKA